MQIVLHQADKRYNSSGTLVRSPHLLDNNVNLPIELRPPKLLDQGRDAVWLKHYSHNTEKTDVHSIRIQLRSPKNPDSVIEWLSHVSTESAWTNLEMD